MGAMCGDIIYPRTDQDCSSPEIRMIKDKIYNQHVNIINHTGRPSFLIHTIFVNFFKLI